MAHHGNQHVDQDDDDGDVVEGEQEHADRLDDRGRLAVVVQCEGGARLVPVAFRRVTDLQTVETNLAEHAPEQAVERLQEAAATEFEDRVYIYICMHVYIYIYIQIHIIDIDSLT